MGIRDLTCLSIKVRDEAYNAYTSVRAKDLPVVDVLRANPVGYLLSRFLAPGAPCKPAVTWLQPHEGRCLTLGDGVHCEIRRGHADVAGKRCIVLFHGNCSDAATTLDKFSELQAYGDLIAVNAPGYGATPPAKHHRQLEWQMATNVQVVATHVARQYAPQNIVWWGFSLGSAQAAMGFQSMAGSHLLLDAAFTHVRALVHKHIGAVAGTRPDGWLSGVLAGCGMAAFPKGCRVPGTPFTTDGLDTEAKLRRCATTHQQAGSRIAIVFAEHDEIMDRGMPKQLWSAYHGPASSTDPDVVHCLYGAGHNGFISSKPGEQQQAFRRHVRAIQISMAKLFSEAQLA